MPDMFLRFELRTGGHEADAAVAHAAPCKAAWTSCDHSVRLTLSRRRSTRTRSAKPEIDGNHGPKCELQSDQSKLPSGTN